MKFCIKSLLKFKVSYVLRAGQLRFACGATKGVPDTAHKKCAIKGTKLGAEGTVTAKSELHKQALGV